MSFATLQTKPEVTAVPKRPRTGDVSEIVHDALRSPGRPLDDKTRAAAEPRFGRDFRHVRVHSGPEADQSAQAIHASAYTVGNEIVFGSGRYQPDSVAGRKLLAHELTHVVQQEGAASSGPIQLVSPTSTLEVQAERMEQEQPFETGQTRPHLTATAGRTVQRSFLGGILGAIGGAIAGVVAGALVGGPLGAVVGGIAGLVGGAVVGDRLTTRRRSLSGPETEYAKDIFRDTVDYGEIEITRDSFFSTGAPKTLGNTIHLKSTPPWNHFKGDTMELTEAGMETLIHEMGHVWQYQNGGLAYIPDSLWAQLKARFSSGSRNEAYDWRAADRQHKPWAEWNPEQQAAAIEQYNKLLRKSKAKTASLAEIAELAILKTYMNEVWNRRGAPHFETPDLSSAPI